MAANEVHLGDVGTLFEVTIEDNGSVVDISLATTKEIIFKQHNSGLLVVDATFVTDGTNGKLKYSFVSGDCDVAGVWKIQGEVILPGGEWSSDIDEFVVHGNLKVA